MSLVHVVSRVQEQLGTRGTKPSMQSPRNNCADNAHRGQPVPIQNPLLVDDQRSDLAGVHVRDGFYMAVVKPVEDDTDTMAMK